LTEGTNSRGEFPESYIDHILSELRQLRGIDLSGYRRNMLERRLAARMLHLQLSDPEAYLERLGTDVAECDRLIDTIMINVSSFFRTPIVFEILAQSILPSILDAKRGRGSKEIRVWSAGCAAGEEAYSTAILVHQALKGEDRGEWRVNLFATDIDSESLEKAATAVFPREHLVNTKLGVLDAYFIPRGSDYEVRPFIREMVHFSRSDLTSPKTTAPTESIYGAFDLVLCRNLLIYFSRELQGLVFDKLYRSLAERGYLILGEAESLCAQMEAKIRIVDGRNRIFQKR